MVWRTGGGTEGTHFVDQIIFQFARRQQRFGFLIEIGFIRRAAAFGDAEKFVLIAIDAVEVNLRRQVGAGVDFGIHIQRRILRITQVIFDVGVIHPASQRRLIAATGPHALPFFTHNDGRAGVLTGRQNTFGGDFRVAQELQCDVLVVFAGIRIAQNIGDLLLMGRAQHK